MSDGPRDDSPIDPGALARRALRAAPWAIGAALLAAGVAAFVDARIPPAYQATLAVRLAPVPGNLPEEVSWPGTPGEVQTLLLGAAIRAELSKDAVFRKAFGAADGPEGDVRFAEEYGRRVSAFPGSGSRALWVVARDPDPAQARRLALCVSEAGLALFRASLVAARTRLEASWDQAQAEHLEEIRRIDAELARYGHAARRERETLPPAEVEQVLARRRVRVEALEEIERRHLAVGAAIDAQVRPWTVLEASTPAANPVPRDRVRPFAAPALFAAALAFLVRFLRDDRPSGT
ncbi:MAG: hypothetical protein IPP07_05625 [Holophagales bacterium]|nr:hypothetical protein [Holophagales bacterium]MBK9964393.1 hypothetical protein [Holophagales bacterium]